MKNISIIKRCNFLAPDDSPTSVTQHVSSLTYTKGHNPVTLLRNSWINTFLVPSSAIYFPLGNL
jgi:hypothetical protein